MKRSEEDPGVSDYGTAAAALPVMRSGVELPLLGVIVAFGIGFAIGSWIDQKYIRHWWE